MIFLVNYYWKQTGQFYSDFVLGISIAQIYQVPLVNAAAWLLSRKCLEAVGGFDPLFLYYGEYDNYCQRATYSGIKIGVIPNAFIIHDREARPKLKVLAFSPEYYKVVERNYKFFIVY